ncbi:MAG TPA: putative glycoside hydrolase [Candidatus Ruthenibacterium merdigallinarum]|nr:putative glycoside hydrolase [Candidatus Ruthenibacterium merdigallinarum]
MDRNMFLYPWDVLDEGAQALAERLQDIGVTSVSLAAAYHSGKFLLPHNPKRHVFLHEDSRCYFPFDRKRYGRLRPKPGELVGEDAGPFWADLLRAFRQRNIRVDAWTVVFHSDRLAGENPDCAQRSAWDEASPHHLCPSNEEVFQYGLALLEDIAAAGADELHLEAVEYGGFLHGAHHEMQAFADRQTLERLFSPCFCPACMERANRVGVDAERLRWQVRRQTQRFFDMQTLQEEDTAEWDAWRAMRAQRIAEFYRTLHRRLRAQSRKTKIRPILWMADGAQPYAAGVDVKLLQPWVDGVMAAYPGAPCLVGAFVRQVREIVPQEMPLMGGVRLMAPQTVRAGQVKEYLLAYERESVKDLFFYNYGMAPLPFLEALKRDEST